MATIEYYLSLGNVVRSDPTAEKAIDSLTRQDDKKGAPNNSSPQAEIEEGIHTLKVQLADGVITRMTYRTSADRLRLSLKQLRKKGGR